MNICQQNKERNKLYNWAHSDNIAGLFFHIVQEQI